MKKYTIIIFLFTFKAVIGQINQPKKVTDFIKTMNLKPLNQVDTLSKELPTNIRTNSGWNMDYYASITQNDGPTQLSVYLIIYNDSVLSYIWTPLDLKTPEYDKYVILKESNSFIYLTSSDKILNDNLCAVSKIYDNKLFQFFHLEYKDFDNNIFIESSIASCRLANIPSYTVTNIVSNKNVEIKFNGLCNAQINKSCIDKVAFNNGKIEISATLLNPQTKKTFVQTKIIDL